MNFRLITTILYISILTSVFAIYICQGTVYPEPCRRNGQEATTDRAIPLLSNTKKETKAKVSIGNNKPNKPTNQNKPRRQKPKPKPKPALEPTERPIPQSREELDKKDHNRICNILGFASNIFGNFINIVRDPHDRNNIGRQVGDMAQTIFNLVAQATTKKVHINELEVDTKDLTDYIISQEFIKELTTLIEQQLEEL